MTSVDENKRQSNLHHLIFDFLYGATFVFWTAAVQPLLWHVHILQTFLKIYSTIQSKKQVSRCSFQCQLFSLFPPHTSCDTCQHVDYLTRFILILTYNIHFYFDVVIVLRCPSRWNGAAEHSDSRAPENHKLVPCMLLMLASAVKLHHRSTSIGACHPSETKDPIEWATYACKQVHVYCRRQ